VRISPRLLLFILLISPALILGDVYKWTDEEGKIHYGNKPPAQIEGEKIQIKQGPSEDEVQGAQQKIERQLEEMNEREERRKESLAKQDEEDQETDTAKLDESLSLEELDRLCEKAREEKIAPLREAAIEACITNPRLRNPNPEEDCQRQNKDFGEGHMHYGQGQSTGITGKMFYDLPECVTAFEARREKYFGN